MQVSYPKNPFCTLELIDSSWKRELTLVFHVRQDMDGQDSQD
jgi:hypothetical protein